MVLLCCLGGTQQAVEMGNDIGILLNELDECLRSSNKLCKELLFQ